MSREVGDDLSVPQATRGSAAALPGNCSTILQPSFRFVGRPVTGPTLCPGERLA